MDRIRSEQKVSICDIKDIQLVNGTETQRLNGNCLCGAVRVAATPVRAAIAACHCNMCRQWTSSMLMTVPVEAGSLEVSGPVKSFTSSEWAERAFCEECGSPLWYRLTGGQGDDMQMQLSAGLFDGAAAFDLKLEMFIDRKPGGYAFEGDRRQMTEAEVIAAFAPSKDDDA